MPRCHVLLLALCATFLLIPVGSASASGSIVANPGNYYYLGGDESSQITVSDDGSNLIFNDTGGVNAGDCVQLSPTSAACDASNQDESIGIGDGGGNDTIDTSGVGAGHDIAYDGGAGVDTFIGHGGFDNIVADDHNAEDVDCGGGTDDQANVDPDDRVVNCERVSQNEPLLSMASASAAEGQGVQFTLGLNKPAEKDFTVDYTVANGTTEDGDFSATGPRPSGTVAFHIGDTSQTVTVPTNDDTYDEPDQTFTLQLSNPQPAFSVRFTNSQQTGTIIDNDPQPSVSIADAAPVEEGASSMFAVTLDRGSDSPVTVNYSIQNDTTSDNDYTGPPMGSGLITFAPHETVQTVVVPIVDDPEYEGTETFSVQLSGAGGATIGTGSATGTITDLNDTPTLGISGGTEVEGGPLTFTVTLSTASQSTVSVDYATSDGTAHAPADYTGTSGTLTFAPGHTVETFDVATADDSVDEDSKTVVATLSDASNAPVGTATASGTITDDDPPSAFSITGGSATEGGAVRFTVTKTGATERTATVDYATSGGTADYTSESGTLSFAPGDTVETFDVQTAGDSVDEDTKTVGATLSNPGNATIATGTASGTIADDDATPTLQISGSTAYESDGAVGFVVSINGASEHTVSVDYATSDGGAHAPGDYTSKSGTFTFAPGETGAKTFLVAVVDDNVNENGETFPATLSNPTHATISTATAYSAIIDDDPPPSLSLSAGSAVEGSPVTFTVTKTGATERTMYVDYATSGGTADYTSKSGTLTLAPGDSAQTFAVDTAGDSVDEDTQDGQCHDLQS